RELSSPARLRVSPGASTSSAKTLAGLPLRHAEAGDHGLDIVRKANAEDAVDRLQLAGADDFRLVVACDNGAVDRAFGATAFDPPHDFLRDRLADGGRLVHRR